MTFDELAKTLPNGFHDAKLTEITTNFVNRTVIIVMDIWVGVEADRERYRRAKVEVSELRYVAIDPPDESYPFDRPQPVRIDLSAPDRAHPAAVRLSKAAHTSKIFVVQWNSFIHIAGGEANLTWLDE